jgi:Methylase of polypeptide chain release factors
MRTAIKYIVGTTWQPLLKKYLTKSRRYSYQNIRLQIPSSVFHPGFFFSTHLLLDQIKKLPLENKKLLEPGAGSGLVSIYAAQCGAVVTATDINPIAVKFLHPNCEANNVRLTIIESDLFDDLPPQSFDIIAINPPYYKKRPQSFADYAWFCGENGEYFEELFARLKNYMHAETIVLMVMCDGCDIGMVDRLAGEHGYDMQIIYTKKNVLETNFIYRIQLRK